MLTVRVANLSLATTEDELAQHFQSRRLRLATTPDSISRGIIFIRTDHNGDYKIAAVSFLDHESFKMALELPPEDRLVRGRTAHIERNFYGFTVLWEGTQGAQVDVIALHGLTGNAFHSWEFSDNHTHFMWLRDSLPRQLQESRILLYGYNSTGAADTSADRLRGISETFMEQLLHTREDGGSISTKTRPIILLGHSVGGLIIKQALLIANMRADGRYNSILESVAGIVFMGTPHQGANGVVAADIVAHMVKASETDVGTDLIASLGPRSLTLFDLTGDFRQLIAAKKIEIATVFETKKTKYKWYMKLVIVDEQSAILGVAGERKVGIHSSHVDLCKFRDPGDASLDTITNLIKEFYRNVTPTVKALPPSTWPVPPDDLKYVDTPEPGSLYPVLVIGEYTYWALSHIDKWNGLTVLAYDKQNKPVGRWSRTGAQDLQRIQYDESTRRVEFIGQGTSSVAFSLSELKVVCS